MHRAGGRCLQSSARPRPDPGRLATWLSPAVRFYFDWEALAYRSDTRFDGVHPVKVYQSLPLDDVLIAVVAHHSQRGCVEEALGRFRERLVIFNIEHPSPEEWATEATAASAPGP